MLGDRWRRLMGARRAGLVAVASAMLVVLAMAASAMATPTGDFAVFAQCPMGNPEVRLCFYGTSTGGEFQINETKVPIKNTVTLQAGSTIDEETGAETFVGAANGDTLSKTPLPVPGGLLGIIAPESLPKFLQNIINKLVSEGLDEVTATAELVGTPTISRINLLFQEGVALSLPVRVKLSNTFLGNECYIGSKSSPITLQFTSGTTNPPKPNKPITGAVGELEFKDEFQYVIIKGNKLVDNSFAVPGVNGCDGLLSILVDPAIELKLGLPSAKGHNTAIFESTLQNATAEAVKASE